MLRESEVQCKNPNLLNIRRPGAGAAQQADLPLEPHVNAGTSSG